jgi:hypothetical protein
MYGGAMWLNDGPVMDGVPADLVTGMGAFGCADEFFLCYSKALDMIIVRAGNSLRAAGGDPGCDKLHYTGNEIFLKMVFDSVIKCN